MTDQNLVSAYDFNLPEALIAQQAVEPRDHARFLRVTPNNLEHKHVFDLPDYLRAGDVLVVNTSKVIPARLYGQRGSAKVEILLHKNMGEGQWEVFARPLKRLHVGDKIVFADDFFAEFLRATEEGLAEVRLNKEGAELFNALEAHGLMPLPPYIRRVQKDPHDEARYQTVYADQQGSVAAPTAGLHFTPELLARIETKGIKIAPVLLHVGAGTFLPVKAEDVRQHKMHAEYAEVSAASAALINEAKEKGRRVVAVGTTATRILETVADDTGRVKEWAGETRIFITPGYTFKCVDVLFTNFHLPKSTLFMLVAAFMGLARMQEAYATAIAANYRFFSYGDACLLEPIKD